jgi:ATP-dependent RNA helicase MRH4
MVLSPDVARTKARLDKTESYRKNGRPIDIIKGPIAGMNRTRVFIPPEEPSPRRPSWRESKGPPKPSTKKPPEENFRALKMQGTLAHVGYGRRSRVKKEISTVTSFDAFPLSNLLKESITPCALAEIQDAIPTPIQRLAIPAMMASSKTKRDEPAELEQFLLAAETGSGKTLAYLLPVLHALKKAEARSFHQHGKPIEAEIDPENPDAALLEDIAASESRYPASRPSAIIMVPTSELVDQVGRLVKAFAHKIKFRAALVSSAYTPAVIRSRLSNPGGMDLLVTTPQLLASIAKSNPVILSRVTHLVVDEADSLLDRSFAEFTGEIITRAKPTLQQLVMCSATIPKRMDSYLRRYYPEIIRLTTPNLHAIPRRVQLTVVDVGKNNYFNNKDLACADVIWKISQNTDPEPEVKAEAESERDIESEEAEDEADSPDSNLKRIIVFVNEREKTTELAEYLQSKGIHATALNRDADARLSKSLLESFSGISPSPNSDPEPEDRQLLDSLQQARRVLPNTRVIVVTDLASRGIDTTFVRDVILYDVPHTSIDFIHRLGRTGRMGRRGRGYVLVGNDDRKDIVSEVRHGMFKGQALI